LLAGALAGAACVEACVGLREALAAADVELAVLDENDAGSADRDPVDVGAVVQALSTARPAKNSPSRNRMGTKTARRGR
jgi:hypothetical protein